MRFFIKFTAIILVVAALVYTAGTLIPEEHTASRTILLSQKPHEVFQVIADYATMPSWNSNTVAVKQLDDSAEGNDVWRFEDKRGHYMVLEEVEKHAPTKLVSRIVKTDYPFGGEWVFELRKNEKGTLLTITENGTIANPLLRVFCRYLSGYDKGIKMFEEALQKKLSAPSSESR